MPEAKPVRARMPFLLCCRSESLKQAPVPTDRRGRLENQPSRARPRLRPPLLAASQDTRRSQSPLADLPLPRGEERRRDGRHPEAAQRGEPTPRLATGLWGQAGLGRRVHPPPVGARVSPRRPRRAMQEQQPRPSAPRQLRRCLSCAELRVAIEMRDPGAESRQ